MRFRNPRVPHSEERDSQALGPNRDNFHFTILSLDYEHWWSFEAGYAQLPGIGERI
jgi:hypothetical protein